MRIALLGGSFDPLHFGHLLLAAELQWRWEPDRLWLLPVARHAFGKQMSSFQDRLEMACIGARLLGDRAEARAVERDLVEQGGDGTTVSLLRHLTAVFPGAHFLLALGADAWADREAWNEFEVVQRLAEVVVFNRAGAAPLEGAGPVLPDVSSTDIRTRVGAGQSIEELVPAEIARYIRVRDLYRQAE